MNKFNKGKLIGVVAASLSAVSLMGVGFATWVIGIQKTDANGNITITADDVKYKSLTVSVAFGDPIKLAETTEPSTAGNPFTFEGTEKGNFTTSATFTFTLGKDFSSADFDFTKIDLSIVGAVSVDTSYTDNKVLTTNVIIARDPDTTYTYFDLKSTSITIDKTKIVGLDEPPTSGKTKLAAYTTSVEFKWGTLFGEKGESPMKYYNDHVPSGDYSTKEAYLFNAYDELKAMQDHYKKNGNIKLSINVGKGK